MCSWEPRFSDMMQNLPLRLFLLYWMNNNVMNYFLLLVFTASDPNVSRRLVAIVIRAREPSSSSVRFSRRRPSLHQKLELSGSWPEHPLIAENRQFLVNLGCRFDRRLSWFDVQRELRFAHPMAFLCLIPKGTFDQIPSAVWLGKVEARWTRLTGASLDERTWTRDNKMNTYYRPRWKCPNKGWCRNHQRSGPSSLQSSEPPLSITICIGRWYRVINDLKRHKTLWTYCCI